MIVQSVRAIGVGAGSELVGAQASVCEQDFPDARPRVSGSAGQLPAEQVQGHATRVPHRRSGPVALCEEEPDHLGGSIGAPRVGVGPDRVPSVPGVSAAMHRPRLSEDDAVEVGVHGAGAGWPVVCSSRSVVCDTEVSAVASRAARRFIAFTGATIGSRSPWNTINGTGPPGPGEPPVRMAANADATLRAAP